MREDKGAGEQLLIFLAAVMFTNDVFFLLDIVLISSASIYFLASICFIDASLIGKLC